MITIEEEDVEVLRSWGMGLENVRENCHFCNTPTSTWHIPSNTPVCGSCAQVNNVSELPARVVRKAS